ncbi:MAG TPA: PIG-L family deacetylase [Candidatus Deferrimicrobiaceae bacterium]|nr:PIG-L family deacetylase [Candidatus Deferrimicrobiaceae bacterium]
MAHVFVAPHSDDAALSCGGLIASLRELGQNVTILTVYSGSGTAGTAAEMTGYQREALGFGTKTIWPASEAFNRAAIAADFPVDDGSGIAPWDADDERLEATQADADAAAKRFWQRASWYRRASIRNKPLAGQVLIDERSTQGAVYTDDVVEAATAGDAIASRRVEDERFALFAEASIVFLDLPDAVFRGHHGDDQLLGAPRPDDEPPFETLRREIVRLEPQQVYFPLGVGNHVDHQLCRAVGLHLLGESQSWVMPGPEWAGKVSFYEDFPYSWWSGFGSLDNLPAGTLDGLPAGVHLMPRLADIGDQLERKVQGVAFYESQLERLFGGPRKMASAVRLEAARVGAQGGLGRAERYWDSYRP